MMIDLKGHLYHLLAKYRSESILILLALLIPTLTFIFTFPISSQTSEDIEFIPATEPAAKNMFIDISGEVQSPDVYELPEGSRLKEVIDKAGGFTDKADIDYISKNFNMARILVDQDKIYIPSTAEAGLIILPSPVANKTESSAGATTGTKININSASLKELDSLPGIGAVTAQKIIDNRPYNTIDDLVSNDIVKSSVFEEIKDLIE